MLVLLDSNLLIGALLKADSVPARIVDAWLQGRFQLLTCQHQIDEIRTASRNPKFRDRLQPHRIGTMLNYLYGATVWREPLPRIHQATDPTDSYLLNLMEAAQPDYAVTGDKRSGLLEIGTMNRTKILKATEFLTQVLHL